MRAQGGSPYSSIRTMSENIVQWWIFVDGGQTLLSLRGSLRPVTANGQPVSL